MYYLQLLFQSLIAFLLIDIVWISQVAAPWMKKATPHLMAATPNFVAAAVFYLIYLSGLLFLILIPALSHKIGYQSVALQSFIFGFVAYATYDLTNLSVMKDYPWTLAVADMIWGGILTMLTALIVYKLNT